MKDYLKAQSRSLIENLVRRLPAVSPDQLQISPVDATGKITVNRRSRNIGHARINWPGPRAEAAALALPGVPEIYDVAVIWRYRSRGVGTYLMNHVHDAIAERGFSSCCVGVWKANVRAIRLYAVLGYVEVSGTEFDDHYETTQADGSKTFGTERSILLVKQIDS